MLYDVKLFFDINKLDVFCFYKLNSTFVARITNILNFNPRYHVAIRDFFFPMWTKASQGIFNYKM